MMMIDFWGDGAEWTTLTASHTLVAGIEFDPDLRDNGVADDAIRRVLMTLSTSIGRLAAGIDGDEVGIPAVSERGPADLPRAADAYQIQSRRGRRCRRSCTAPTSTGSTRR